MVRSVFPLRYAGRDLRRNGPAPFVSMNLRFILKNFRFYFEIFRFMRFFVLEKES